MLWAAQGIGFLIGVEKESDISIIDLINQELRKSSSLVQCKCTSQIAPTRCNCIFKKKNANAKLFRKYAVAPRRCVFLTMLT
jgi:hypothetical protein